MKKSLLILFTLFAVSITAGAQKFALIDMEYILKNIPAFSKMNSDYNYYIEVTKEKGSEYRRISVAFTFVDAF